VQNFAKANGRAAEFDAIATGAQSRVQELDKFLDYAGPDLLAMWYQRNTRIYHNIRALVSSPQDRILVIYGAGPLGWLRQDISSDASVSLRKLSDLTGHP